MKNIIRTAAALVVLSASGAIAAPATCVFDHWKGAKSNEASQSWIGTGFAVRKGKGGAEVSAVFGDQSTDWFQVQTKSAGKFNTYIFRLTNSPAPGHVVQSRFSYRVYDTGKCQGYVETRGFVPIIAKGQMQ